VLFQVNVWLESCGLNIAYSEWSVVDILIEN